MDACQELPPIVVTTQDHRRLMRAAQELAGQAHPLATPLLQELGRAALCTPDELPDDVVSLDTFVTYRLADGSSPEKRMLIHPDDGMWPLAEVSVLTPVGLSLLGLRIGDRMPVIGSGGAPGTFLSVESVGPRVIGTLEPVGAMMASSSRWH
ncbi:GreA/GreB family elongation factor [Microvirga sp. 17 mud 1-3]|uniref:GreA/GreB family elongation factor n=1 Tax=Microvirga sp. 17 mud 1-3 TaxID=2082949 RepID=UPI000D6AABC4|nr:GreA/GreB family elongation factor [Microvirga sp. 17 mud 1-3]AWM85430.1 transcription elongation factor [Microvirga sp. 17 mud 1-3]